MRRRERMSQSNVQPRQILVPPDKGSFPLDHLGECKQSMQAYMQCMQSRRFQSTKCRQESHDYLQCRMDKGKVRSAQVTPFHSISFVTLAISQCYGKVRVLLFSARQLSHFTRQVAQFRCSWSSGKMFAFQPRGFVFEPMRMRQFFLQAFRSKRFSHIQCQ